MRTLIMGDVHGMNKLLVDALEKASYDPRADLLLCVGDLVDGGPDSAEVLDFFAEDPERRISVRGNHDQWALEWLESGVAEAIWTGQGGAATVKSLIGKPALKYLPILKAQVPFHERTTDAGNKILVLHAGFEPDMGGPGSRAQDQDVLIWDRTFFFTQKGLRRIVRGWDRIFIGHTQVEGPPVKYGNVWNLDTAAGWNGVLTVMDADSEEYWQSEPVAYHYPRHNPRTGAVYGPDLVFPKAALRQLSGEADLAEVVD